MQLSERIHKRIMKQGEEVFGMLEEYDKTREWPMGRERIYITLDEKVLKKLKALKKRTEKPISRIIEDKFV